MLCSGSPGKCKRKNIVYTFKCNLCKEEDKIGVYFGESSRTGYDRGAEHAAALAKMDQNSPLVEHHLEIHEGRTPSFTMEVVQTFLRPLDRQVMEGVLIQSFKGDFLMNRRGEWGQNLPPQFTTATDDKVAGVARIQPQKRTAEEDAGYQKRRRVEAEVETGGIVRIGRGGGEVVVRVETGPTPGRGAENEQNVNQKEVPKVRLGSTRSGAEDHMKSGAKDQIKAIASEGEQGAKLSLGGQGKAKITNYFGVIGVSGGSREVRENSGVRKLENVPSVVSVSTNKEEILNPEEGDQRNLAPPRTPEPGI